MLKLKRIALCSAILLIPVLMTGCIEPYNTPEFIKIEPSQTGFIIPLVGDTTDQLSFGSEEFLQSKKVATKEIQVPKRKVEVGRMYWEIEWRPSATIIVVERKPETREWTSSDKTGTSKSDQAIWAESKESIGFCVSMNISAQINESDAAKFLYRYNNKPLSEIMDDEIRARVESKFVEECSKRTLDEILLQKQEIMQSVNEYVIPYFAERGIDITVLGLKDGLTYENAAIQQSIDNKFKTAQDVIAQENINKKMISEKEAIAKAAIVEAEGVAKANGIKSNSITERVLDDKYLEKWDGKLPQVVSDGSMIYQFNNK